MIFPEEGQFHTAGIFKIPLVPGLYPGKLRR
jgi:hypothetical protein